MRYEPKLPDDRVNVSPTHPLREAAFLLGGVVAVVLVFVVFVATTIDLIVPRLPPGLEMSLFAPSWLPDSIGDDQEDEPVRSKRIWLQAMVERMAGHWEENPYVFRVVVLERGEPNALAFPGGWIAVTESLLEQAESENEVAFVVGHELGHFRNRDHLRGLGRGLALSLATTWIGASGAGEAARLAELAGILAERGFSREQERDADVFGLQLVHAEYGHVAGADDFFARMGGVDGDRDGTLSSYLSTHPVNDERVETLHEEAVRLGYSERGDLIALPKPGPNERP